LAKGNGGEGSPLGGWSPDSKLIVVEGANKPQHAGGSYSGRDSFVDVATGQFKPILQVPGGYPSEPSFSPSGDSYALKQQGKPGIYVVNIDTGKSKHLTPGNARTQIGDPVYGSRNIAFPETTVRPNHTTTPTKIAVVRPDGSHYRVFGLTAAPRNKVVLGWAPGGNTLLAAVPRLLPSNSNPHECETAIFGLDARSGATRRLRRVEISGPTTPYGSTGCFGSTLTPREFSPDGRSLLAVSHDNTDQASIFQLPVGGGPRRLIASGGANLY
jgi:hypothetical protein